MHDESEEQTDEAAEATAEDSTAEAEGADDTAAEAEGDDAAGEDEGASAEDADTADAVESQAGQGGAGDTVLKQPEVPSDSNDKIAAAQQHIDNLNMDEERAAAEQAQKQL
jgi:hypothetical protein